VSDFLQKMSEFTARQQEAIRLLSQGCTQAQVAEQIGVSRRTVERWMSLPEFRQSVNDVGHEVTERLIFDTASELNRLLPLAFSNLQEILQNQDVKTSDRLRACHILGSWAGLSQPKTQKQEDASDLDLKSYLAHLAKKESNNGKH
jgi:transcriptional regulator with XRE-family HTH domain